eukprot:6490371-Amphidinium_carterae.2
MLLGHESIFQAMRDRKLITEYELHGFAKLDLVGVKFLVSTAFISYVSEGFILSAVMRDNRVALNAVQLWGDMQAEVQYLEGIGWAMWQLFATVVPHCDARELRHTVLQGAFSSVSYLMHRVFREAQSLPWSLTSTILSAVVRRWLSRPSSTVPENCFLPRDMSCSCSRGGFHEDDHLVHFCEAIFVLHGALGEAFFYKFRIVSALQPCNSCLCSLTAEHCCDIQGVCRGTLSERACGSSDHRLVPV